MARLELQHRLRHRMEGRGRTVAWAYRTLRGGPLAGVNRNSTDSQLLLLGVKAARLSLREEQQETGPFNPRASEEWLHDGPKGRPLTFGRLMTLTDSHRRDGRQREPPGSYNCGNCGYPGGRASPTLFGLPMFYLKGC